MYIFWHWVMNSWHSILSLNIAASNHDNSENRFSWFLREKSLFLAHPNYPPLRKNNCWIHNIWLKVCLFNLFLYPIIFFNWHFNCSNVLDLIETSSTKFKSIPFQKLFWLFTVWINGSSHLKLFSNSRPLASNLQVFLDC